MITKDFAKKQVLRLGGLMGFPQTVEAANELIIALQVAGDPQQAEGWVSGFLDDSSSDTRCPSPGDIKRSLLDRKQATAAIRRCGICEGSGWLTVWKLVTYRTGTYQVLRAEAIELPVEDPNDLRTCGPKFIGDFRAKLPPDQAILSAAKACACLLSTHKYYTGERK